MVHKCSIGAELAKCDIKSTLDLALLLLQLIWVIIQMILNRLGGGLLQLTAVMSDYFLTCRQGPGSVLFFRSKGDGEVATHHDNWSQLCFLCSTLCSYISMEK